jgi:hypothetical protein
MKKILFWIAAPVIQIASAREKITAHPNILFLAPIILFVIIMIVDGIIVDQYSCWVGVPNCDLLRNMGTSPKAGRQSF